MPNVIFIFYRHKFTIQILSCAIFLALFRLFALKFIT